MTQYVTVKLGDDGDPVTNATVTLTDRATVPTYGIRTAVGNAIVVAANTAVPHVGGGVYTYPFTTGAGGTAYEATLKVVWPDGAIDFYDRPFTLPSAALPLGYYGTLLDVQNAGGKKNVLTYSNLDGRKDAPDYERLQVVMTQTDGRVTDYLKLNFISKPAAGSSGFGMLSQAWALWVLATIYKSRGDLDVQNDSEGQVSSQVWDREARRLLRLYVMRVRSNLTGQIAFT